MTDIPIENPTKELKLYPHTKCTMRQQLSLSPTSVLYGLKCLQLEYGCPICSSCSDSTTSPLSLGSNPPCGTTLFFVTNAACLILVLIPQLSSTVTFQPLTCHPMRYFILYFGPKKILEDPPPPYIGQRHQVSQKLVNPVHIYHYLRRITHQWL